jgi:hypothetical protein
MEFAMKMEKTFSLEDDDTFGTLTPEMKSLIRRQDVEYIVLALIGLFFVALLFVSLREPTIVDAHQRN